MRQRQVPTTMIPVWWKSPVHVLLVCFGLMLLFTTGGASVISCNVLGAPVAPSVVEDAAGAMELAEVVNCGGGSFDVEWVGFVTLATPIVVPQNTSLRVTGAADGSSRVDGGNQLSLFKVLGGTLYLTGLTLSRGVNKYGGAIFANSTRSTVTVANCTFANNTATFGGAISLESANLVLSSAYFAGNIAEDSGGAINSHRGAFIVVNGDTLWDGNKAINGGAIRLFSESALNILSSATFTNNFADHGGGVWLSENSEINIKGSVSFDGNTGTEEAGGLLVWSSSAHFMVNSTAHFISNSAVEGGATMQIGDGEIIIEGHAIFTSNTAERGGAMQMLEGTVAIITGEVTMWNNTASSSGGAMYCEAMELLHLHNTRFALNSAGSSGGAVTMLSVGTRSFLALLSACSFEENKSGDAGGGIFIAGGFVNITDSNFTRNIAERSGGAILASGMVDLAHCLLEYNRAYTGPALSNTVTVSISWTDFDGNALLCNDGYFLDFDTNVSAYDMACHACSRELDCEHCIIRNRDEVQVCQPVLVHTTSPLANGTLQSLHVQPGFWRRSHTSKDIRKCYEEEACVGGSEGYCADGYTGPFCAVCADGFARGLGYVCIECNGEHRITAIAITAVIFVVFVATIAFGIKFLAFSSEVESAPPRQTYKRARSRLKIARASQGLKIVVVSWQIITQLAAVASVTYPEVYDVFLKYVDAVNLDLGWILATGCVIKINFYVNLLVSTIGPLIVAILVLVSYNVNRRRCPIDNSGARIRIRSRHVSVIFWLSFLLYATVSSSIFQCFACDNLDNGKSYLRADHRMECYTGEHRFFMVYAGIMSIVYPFGIPFCYGVILSHNRTTLRMAVSREVAIDALEFKDLWWQYRPEAYFYEVVECLRRVFLSGIVVFIFPNTAGQLATTFLIALFFFAVLMCLNPYIDRWVGWLAMIGHVVVMMSMFVALMQKVNTSDDDALSQNVFAGVLIAVNCIMILAVGAEGCGICLVFIRIQEVDIPVRSTHSSQSVLRTSSVLVDLPVVWNSSESKEQIEPPSYSEYLRRERVNV